MANEKRLRTNLVAGALSGALTTSDTTMSSAGLADLGVVDTTNHAAIAIFSADATGRVTAKEVVYVTAHTAAATTATILRAQESTTATAWSSATTWAHASTAKDFEVTYLTATISSNVAFAGAQVFVDGPSVSLYPATWLVMATVDVQPSSPDWVATRVWDGTTVYGASSSYIPNSGGGVGVAITTIITLASTTTVKVSSAPNGATAGNLLAIPAVMNTGSTGKVSRITGIRLL
jgi:hypothetical protein